MLHCHYHLNASKSGQAFLTKSSELYILSFTIDAIIGLAVVLALALLVILIVVALLCLNK